MIKFHETALHGVVRTDKQTKQKHNLSPNFFGGDNNIQTQNRHVNYDAVSKHLNSYDHKLVRMHIYFNNVLKNDTLVPNLRRRHL